MAGGGGELEYGSTPSWVIGAVVFLMVAISWVVEKLLSFVGQRLKSKEKKPLYEALQKIKEELMLLGFISLFLAVFQDNIASKCIPEKLATKWTPCNDHKSTSKVTSHLQGSLFYNGGRRLLAEEVAASCPKGKVPFVSIGVIHDLHYLVFILAIVHAVSCTVTVLLGKVKIRQWWKWEEDIRKQNDADTNTDRVIDIRSLTFFKDRFASVDANKRTYVISFFKHLAGIVTKADYTAMRMGFTLTHCNGKQRFNFHKYMVYAYEADFQRVVSIGWFLWLFVVISLTLNVADWNIYFWISFIPLILKFGFKSCVMGAANYVYARIIVMVVVQTICSYSTLPLYAIVTQMGSSYNEEAMAQYGYGSSNRVTERISGDPNGAASVEMANQQEGPRNS